MGFFLLANHILWQMGCAVEVAEIESLMRTKIEAGNRCIVVKVEEFVFWNLAKERFDERVDKGAVRNNGNDRLCTTL